MIKKLIALLALNTTQIELHQQYQTMPADSIRDVTTIESNDEVIHSTNWQTVAIQIHTPTQAQKYLDQYMHQSKPTKKIDSVSKNLKDQVGDCLDYALMAAAFLKDDDYTSAILRMFTSDYKRAHAVFIYRSKDKFGAIGNSPMEPEYSSIEDLINAIENKYHFEFESYQIIDVDKSFPNNRWITGPKFNELYTSLSTTIKLG